MEKVLDFLAGSVMLDGAVITLPEISLLSDKAVTSQEKILGHLRCVTGEDGN